MQAEAAFYLRNPRARFNPRFRRLTMTDWGRINTLIDAACMDWPLGILDWDDETIAANLQMSPRNWLELCRKYVALGILRRVQKKDGPPRIEITEAVLMPQQDDQRTRRDPRAEAMETLEEMPDEEIGRRPTTEAERTAYSRACRRAKAAGKPEPAREAFLAQRRAGRQASQGVTISASQAPSACHIVTAPDVTFVSHSPPISQTESITTESEESELRNNKNSSESARDSDAEKAVVVASLCDTNGINMSRSVAEHLAETYPLARIRNQIEWLPFRDCKGSRAGMLRKAIEEGEDGWAAPDAWVAKERETARRSQQQATAEQKRRAAQEMEARITAYWEALSEEERSAIDADARKQMSPIPRQRLEKNPQNALAKESLFAARRALIVARLGETEPP